MSRCCSMNDDFTRVDEVVSTNESTKIIYSVRMSEKKISVYFIFTLEIPYQA